MRLPGFVLNMHEAEMAVHDSNSVTAAFKKQLLFLPPPPWKRIKVEHLASAKFILISSCWNVSLSLWSTAKGSGLEQWCGGYF